MRTQGLALCSSCASLPRGHAMRPHLCDLPPGERMCAGLRDGTLVEGDVAWQPGAAEETGAEVLERQRRVGKPVRITFTEPTRRPEVAAAAAAADSFAEL